MDATAQPLPPVLLGLVWSAVASVFVLAVHSLFNWHDHRISRRLHREMEKQWLVPLFIVAHKRWVRARLPSGGLGPQVVIRTRVVAGGCGSGRHTVGQRLSRGVPERPTVWRPSTTRHRRCG